MSILSTIKSHIILFIMQSSFYEWMVVHVIPFIRISFYYSDMCGYKYKRAYKLLKPGDIILCKDDWKLTSWLIPGELTHACLCVDKGEYIEFEVAEMHRAGFIKSSFYDPFRESTRLVILRCVDWDNTYVKQVIERCRLFEDVPYDITFEFGVKALYCSELIYQSDFEKRLEVSIEDLLGLGRPYISPMGLYNAKNVDIIYDSSVDIQTMTI